MSTNDLDRQESNEHSSTTDFHAPEDDAVILADGGTETSHTRPRTEDERAELPTDREVALAALYDLADRQHVRLDEEVRFLLTDLKDTRDGRSVPDPEDVEMLLAKLSDFQEMLEERVQPLAYREA